MKDKWQEPRHQGVLTDACSHSSYPIQVFPGDAPQPSQICDADSSHSFTDADRFKALQTIIQHMIHVYGFPATRDVFLMYLMNHTLTLDTE